MRIDGFAPQSYPIKRKPRKGGLVVDDQPEDIEGEIEARSAQQRSRAGGAAVSNLPARQQDMIFHRSLSKRAATALASYLTTATFVEWDNEVLGLDVHI